MSLEDLEKAGILLPREDWGSHDIHTRVRKGPLLVVSVMTPVALGMMYVGNGARTTWLGLVLFLGLLGAFTFVTLRGVR